MVKSLCVSIPIELRQYQKIQAKPDNVPNCTFESSVRIFRNSDGEVEHAAYYSDTGELLKRVYYKGSAIINIKHYRNNLLYINEEYTEGKLGGRVIYDNKGNVSSSTYYTYNRQDKITSIRKQKGVQSFRVDYGYDELNRVNSRKVYLNAEVIKEQTYRYDILDRIVEYKDDTQVIKINTISKNNELISYKITDKIGNEISVLNKFDAYGYARSEIYLNGHTISVRDKSYLDNIMLKQPYTTEDDLDFIISNLFSSPLYGTKRENTSDISSDVIQSNIQNRTVPISMRKRLLYNIS